MNIVRLSALCILALFTTTSVSFSQTKNNIIDNYLDSFTGTYSEQFTFGAYCYGLLMDVGSELSEWGTEENDREIRVVGERIVKRADKYFEDYLFPVFDEEIVKDWYLKENTTDDEDELAGEKFASAITDVAASDLYYAVYDQLSDYEFYGVYGLCTSLFTPNTILSRDISLEKLILTTDGEKPFLQRVSDSIGDGKDVAIDWTKTKYTEITSIDVCDINTDLAGGVFIGTAATSVLAGNSVMAVVGSAGVLVLSAPAVASGMTLSAIGGSAVYLTSKGYCYLKK